MKTLCIFGLILVCVCIACKPIAKQEPVSHEQLGLKTPQRTLSKFYNFLIKLKRHEFCLVRFAWSRRSYCLT